MSESNDLGLESKRISVNGIELHVMLGGPEDAPMAVLLHGFPEYWGCWRGQIPDLLAAGYRVVVPDMRGYNLSDKPSGLAHYTKDTLAADVVDLIKALGRDKAHIVAHDWGGVVAWWLVLKHPEVVERIVVMNIPHPVAFSKALTSSFAQIRSSWYVFFFQLPWIPEWVLSRNDFAALAGTYDTAKPGAITEEDMQGYKSAWSQPGTIKGMLSYYRAAAWKSDERPVSYKVERPLLLIWGKNDVALTVQLAKSSIEFCADGRLELLDASHWVQNDCPEQVSEMVLEHLGGAPPN